MIATAVVVMGGLAAICAALLIVASRRLAVAEDERLEAVLQALPGNNCGACGQPGCRGFAAALLAGTARPVGCTVASAEQRIRIAELVGSEVGDAERLVARLACAGGNNVARLRARYVGEPSCAAAALISGGGRGCFWGCLGYGDCAASCTFDAIGLDEHDLPVVDEDACTACGDCLEACPKNLFHLESAADRLWVACSNRDAGDGLLEECEVVCTACARCALDAPELIAMEDNLPRLTASRGANRTAIERCPTGAIVWIGEDGRPQRGRQAAVVVRQGARPIGST